MKLNNAVVLLTGASQGIGRALALQLDQQGCRLLLVGRNAAALESVAAKCSGEPVLIAADLAEEAGIVRVVQAVKSYSGMLDAVINNAGMQQQLELSSGQSVAGFEQEIRINLLAPARPLAKKMSAAAMAAVMVRGLQRDAQFIVPWSSRALLVLNRFFPTLVANMMMRE